MEFKIAFSSMELAGKIPQGDYIWPQFNASFENMEVSAPMISYMIDEGRAFTTWHNADVLSDKAPKDAKQWRNSDNFMCGQHIGLDFDTEDERSSIDTLIRDPFIARYGGIIYSSPSSTPESPRSRVVFLLDTPIIQGANYRRAAEALIFTFGISDAKCKDPCRFFYGALGSMPARLGNLLPLAKLRETIAKHEAFKALTPARPPSNFKATTPDAAEAEKLLSRISPARADNYEEWVNVGMALRQIGDQGLSLWDQWSARSAKYHAGECERKWSSFKPGEGITFATLGYFAKQDSPR